MYRGYSDVPGYNVSQAPYMIMSIYGINATHLSFDSDTSGVLL